MRTTKKTVITLEGNDELEIRVPDSDGEMTSIEIARNYGESGGRSEKEPWTIRVDRQDLFMNFDDGHTQVDDEDISAGLNGHSALIIFE